MPVITNSQKQYNPDGDGPLEKYLAANDNVPRDESGQSAGFGVGAERGMYVGLRRRTDIGKRVVAAVDPPRIGDFMQTYTARKYWPIDPRADEVFIEDIAHSLSLQSRYAGHCLNFYSVAEHSVHIARWLHREYGPLTAFYGLLHDATEAFCVDVPRPLKPSLTNYKAIEQRNWLVIAERFGLPSAMPDAVHEADTRIIADELVNMRPMDWHARHDNPLGVRIGCWSPAVAEQEFLSAFGVLDAATKDVRRVA